MKAIMLMNGSEKIFIPVPNLKVNDDDDVKVIKAIMNMQGFGVEEKLSVINSYLRFLKNKQGE